MRLREQTGREDTFLEASLELGHGQLSLAHLPTLMLKARPQLTSLTDCTHPTNSGILRRRDPARRLSCCTCLQPPGITRGGGWCFGDLPTVRMGRHRALSSRLGRWPFLAPLPSSPGLAYPFPSPPVPSFSRFLAPPPAAPAGSGDCISVAICIPNQSGLRN